MKITRKDLFEFILPAGTFIGIAVYTLVYFFIYNPLIWF